MTSTPPATYRYRLREVPLVAGDDPALRAGARRAALMPALHAARALGAPLATLVVRHRRGAALQVAVDVPDALVDLTAGARLPCLFPPGATVMPVDPPAIATACGGLTWTDLHLAIAPHAATAPVHAGRFVEDHVAHLGMRAFGIAVTAQPAPDAAVRQRLQELSAALPGLRLRAPTLAADQRELELAEAELAYLHDSAADGGLWEVRVRVGSSSAAEATAIAALLTAPSDLAGLPVQLRAQRSEHPLLASVEVAAALVHPPSRELAGLRAVERPAFDLTPERRGPFVLGDVLDGADQPCGELSIGPDTLNRHVFVTGATGAGKSQTVRRLLHTLTAASVPWLVVEPSKSEYASMAAADGHGAVTVIRPGDPHAAPAGLNPLEPSHLRVGDEVLRFPLQTHVDLVRSLFTAAFEAVDPFPQVMAAALARAYERQGWDLAVSAPRSPTSWTPRYPTLRDLEDEAMHVVDGIGYGPEVRGNVRGLVGVRLSSLRLGTTGSFFESGHPLDLDALLQRPAVLEIEDIGSDTDQAFLMGTLVIRIVELLRLRAMATGAPNGLRHVLVLEEAHRLLRRAEPGTPAARAVELFADILAEVRAYGEGIVVAEQIPSKIIPDVVKNTALKVVHRLPSSDDREFVGATMNLSEEQSRATVAFPPGVAAVHADGMDRPVRVRIAPLRVQPGRRPAAAAAPTSPPSAACPESCGASPCTLAELRAAAAIASADDLARWVDVTVLAHVGGRAVPAVRREWIAELRSRHPDGGRLRCAIAGLCRDAVDRRSGAIVGTYDPAELVRHVASSLLMQLRGGPPCSAETGFQAGGFRYIDVVDDLVRRRQQGQGPITALDALRDRGLVLHTTTLEEQRLEVSHAHRRLSVPGLDLLAGERPVLTAALPAVGGRSLDDWRRDALAQLPFLDDLPDGLARLLRAAAPPAGVGAGGRS